MHKEVKFEVLSGRNSVRNPPYSLSWELEEGVTCSEIVPDLVETLQLQQKEAWHLVEVWNGCGERYKAMVSDRSSVVSKKVCTVHVIYRCVQGQRYKVLLLKTKGK